MTDVEEKLARFKKELAFCKERLERIYSLDMETRYGKAILSMVTVGRMYPGLSTEAVLAHYVRFVEKPRDWVEKGLQEAVGEYFGIITWREIYEDVVGCQCEN